MCEYCENFNVHGEGLDFVDGEFTDRFHLGTNEFGDVYIECYADRSAPINFCPMCGRNFKEK